MCLVVYTARLVGPSGLRNAIQKRPGFEPVASVFTTDHTNVSDKIFILFYRKAPLFAKYFAKHREPSSLRRLQPRRRPRRCIPMRLTLHDLSVGHSVVLLLGQVSFDALMNRAFEVLPTVDGSPTRTHTHTHAYTHTAR